MGGGTEEGKGNLFMRESEVHKQAIEDVNK